MLSLKVTCSRTLCFNVAVCKFIDGAVVIHFTLVFFLLKAGVGTFIYYVIMLLVIMNE